MGLTALTPEGARMSLFDKLGSVMGGGGSGEGQWPALVTGVLEVFDKGSEAKDSRPTR